MEQNEGFQIITETLKMFENQLQVCDKSLQQLEDIGTTAEQSIEHHFEKCFHALAARKAELLNECALTVKNQSIPPSSLFSTFLIFRTEKNYEDIQKRVKELIGGCKKIMETGVFLFNTDVRTAEGIWKVLSVLYYS
jgi:hypothetical protein